MMLAQRTGSRSGVGSLLVLLLVVWLAIGAIASAQRHYFSGGSDNCAHAGTVAVTILDGPLNYVGANPRISNCALPQPSK